MSISIKRPIGIKSRLFDKNLHQNIIIKDFINIYTWSVIRYPIDYYNYLYDRDNYPMIIMKKLRQQTNKKTYRN